MGDRDVRGGSDEKIFELKYSIFSYYFHNSGNTAYFPTGVSDLGRAEGGLSDGTEIEAKLHYISTESASHPILFITFVGFW